MCDPITLTAATLAVSAAGTTMAYVGQKQAAEANEHAANLTAANTYTDLSQRAVQADAAESENILSALIDRTAAQGEISASASAFGTGEATTTQLGNAADFAAGRAGSIDQLNARSQRVQLAAERTGVGIRRQSQINSVMAPSALSLALGFAEDGLGAANTSTQLGGKF